jgi:aminobenzoyl-glutamate utilization protein B
MCLAGKTLAATAIALLSDSALLENAQQEFRQAREQQPYHCPIPAGVKPSPLA